MEVPVTVVDGEVVLPHQKMLDRLYLEAANKAINDVLQNILMRMEESTWNPQVEPTSIMMKMRVRLTRA